MRSLVDHISSYQLNLIKLLNRMKMTKDFYWCLIEHLNSDNHKGDRVSKYNKAACINGIRLPTQAL